MKLFSSKKRVAAIGAVTAVTLVGGGVAYAYFTSTGSGTGTATTGTATSWAVAVTSSAAGNLTPTSLSGVPSQTVPYTITNNGSGQQYLDKAVVSVSSITPTVTGPNECTALDFSISGAPVGEAYTETVATNMATSSSYNGSVVLRLVDNGANQDSCQGASVELTVQAS